MPEKLRPAKDRPNGRLHGNKIGEIPLDDRDPASLTPQEKRLLRLQKKEKGK